MVTTLGFVLFYCQGYSESSTLVCYHSSVSCAINMLIKAHLLPMWQIKGATWLNWRAEAHVPMKT